LLDSNTVVDILDLMTQFNREYYQTTITVTHDILECIQGKHILNRGTDLG